MIVSVSFPSNLLQSKHENGDIVSLAIRTSTAESEEK